MVKKCKIRIKEIKFVNNTKKREKWVRNMKKDAKILEIKKVKDIVWKFKIVIGNIISCAAKVTQKLSHRNSFILVFHPLFCFAITKEFSILTMLQLFLKIEKENFFWKKGGRFSFILR